MSYRQLVVPNLSVSGQIGWCLDYARRVFSAPAGILYASQSWQLTKQKHRNADFPTDVVVPIWFDYQLGGMNQGHVAIHVPGKGIYSSPWKAGTSSAVLRSVDELIRIYSSNGKNPMTFVGWSEDINGVRVVEPQGGDDMSRVGPVELNILSLAFFGYPANDEFIKAHNGKETNTFVRWCEANSAFIDREKKTNDLVSENAKLREQLAAGGDPKALALLRAVREAVKD
jgi:hypothetical protein